MFTVVFVLKLLLETSSTASDCFDVTSVEFEVSVFGGDSGAELAVNQTAAVKSVDVDTLVADVLMVTVDVGRLVATVGRMVVTVGTLVATVGIFAAAVGKLVAVVGRLAANVGRLVPTSAEKVELTPVFIKFSVSLSCNSLEFSMF